MAVERRCDQLLEDVEVLRLRTEEPRFRQSDAPTLERDGAAQLLVPMRPAPAPGGRSGRCGCRRAVCRSAGPRAVPCIRAVQYDMARTDREQGGWIGQWRSSRARAGASGRWIALGLAQAEHHVVMVVRDRGRGEAAQAWIAGRHSGASTELVLADLSLMAQVRAAGEAILAAHPGDQDPDQQRRAVHAAPAGHVRGARDGVRHQLPRAVRAVGPARAGVAGGLAVAPGERRLDRVRRREPVSRTTSN